MIYRAPIKKRVVAFFDCQNLFLSAKELQWCTSPDFDPIKLSQKIVANHLSDCWVLDGIRLYTGMHDRERNLKWHDFWTRKLSAHKARDSRVHTFTSPLRYANGAAREKGVGVRIALDLVLMAIEGQYDIALLFSRDNGFAEAVNEIRVIAQKQQRWIKIASAFPYAIEHVNGRGVNNTEWIRISKVEYDACIDRTDYRA